MPIYNGEIFCKCGEKFDKQPIIDILLSESKIKDEAIEIEEKIKGINDDIKRLNKEQCKLSSLCATLYSLELLIDELGDSKFYNIVRVSKIIEKNIPSPLILRKKGEDKHYERNYFICIGNKDKGEIQLGYDGDFLTAHIILYGIGENNFIINDERILEVLHFVESINCKKE